MSAPMGPNVKKLVARRMAMLAIPPGGGFGDGVALLCDPKKLAATGKDATAWVHEAIAAVRAAPDCKWTTDEEIAGELLRLAEAREPSARQRLEQLARGR